MITHKDLTAKLTSTRLECRLVQLATESGKCAYPVYFPEGYSPDLAVHNVVGTVWYTVTHVPSGMAFPPLHTYPEVKERMAWIPHGLMSRAALLCALAQVHFLSSSGVDWRKISPSDIKEVAMPSMRYWESFVARTLEDMVDLAASEAASTISARGKPANA
jgi:hypothetical protein